MTHILANKIVTPDGTVLHSVHRHDFVTHTDIVTGEWYMTDGGNEYLKRSVNKVPYTDLTVTSDHPHEVIRDHFCWGTRGPHGDQPLTWVVLKDMTLDHIVAILENCELQPHISRVFVVEVLYRLKGLKFDSVVDEHDDEYWIQVPHAIAVIGPFCNWSVRDRAAYLTPV
jgi:hypothetical protein